MEYIIEIAVALFALVTIGTIVYKSRKSGSKEIPWTRIQPIIAEALIRIKEIKDMKGAGYQAVENYAVLLIRTKIRKADFLSDVEKALITDDLIRSLIAPTLIRIYNNK